MDSSRQAIICIAIAYDRYNILLNTRSAWNCGRTYNPLIYKALPAIRSTVYQFIPFLWPEYQGFVQISCLDVCLLTYRSNLVKACARCGPALRRETPSRSRFARSQIIGRGLERRDWSAHGGRSSAAPIFSALPNMVAGVEPGHKNIVTCSTPPCKRSCLLSSRS
jgi:hypothetical protein